MMDAGAVMVRRAVPEDAPELWALNFINNDVRATVEHLARHIRERSAFETPFVAVVTGRIVGMACLRLLPTLCDSAPYAELTELIVHPDLRRRGVGTALVDRIEGEARAGGASALTLMTAWQNTNAHAFYHPLGYRLYTAMMQKAL